MTISAPLCEHPSQDIVRRSFRAVCGACGSYWDLDSCATEPVYDERYPAQRGHYDPRVGALKVRTLQRWVRQGRLGLAGKTVCEVGFGGGSCLSFLAERAARVIGLEANPSAIERVRLAVDGVELLSTEARPDRLDRLVDVWIFQDSFEHIPDPTAFAMWMAHNSSAAAEILIVLPRGDSLSQRLMGKLWPHKLPDHQFHWSRAGLVEFFAKRGFEQRAEFFPLKFVSPQMVITHFLHKAGAPLAMQKWLGGAAFALPLNFGEMGFVFRRVGA